MNEKKVELTYTCAGLAMAALIRTHVCDPADEQVKWIAKKSVDMAEAVVAELEAREAEKEKTNARG